MPDVKVVMTEVGDVNGSAINDYLSEVLWYALCALTCIPFTDQNRW